MLSLAAAPAAAVEYGPGWDIPSDPPADPAALPPVTRTVTYDVRVLGPVRSDLGEFVAAAEAAYADARGWRAAGIELQRVVAGGDFTLWLATPDGLPLFSRVCSPVFSCRVDDNVVVNDDRFAGGSPAWPGSLEDYRQLVINHETGHFLGLRDESGCPGAGLPAPVMQQQSKGLDGCAPNVWPTPSELDAVRG